MRRFLLACVALLFACGGDAPEGDRAGPPPPAADELDLAHIFGDLPGAFCLLDGQSGDMRRHNPERAAERFSPASTFKIPHALIGLESGRVEGPEFRIDRNAELAPHEPWWPEGWLRSHTLRTAFAGSVVWYYQEMARRVGTAEMEGWLARFDYGNRDISSGIDAFWLHGSLEISCEEQLSFLRRFHGGDLGVSERSTASVKDLLVLEETDEYRWSGKSGWAGFGDPAAPQLGWLVGYVERDERVWFYAMNLDMRDAGDAASRAAITRAALEELGLLPPAE